MNIVTADVGTARRVGAPVCYILLAILVLFVSSPERAKAGLGPVEAWIGHNGAIVTTPALSTVGLNS